MGGGHGSSRATYMGGTAIWRACDIIIAKGQAIAARALEAAEADIAFADGVYPRRRHRPDDHPAGNRRHRHATVTNRSTPTTSGRGRR